MSKQLIIGDIHGCYDELQALLDLVGPSEADEIICVGDLFDRGPKPYQVHQFFTTHPNTHAIMGNHERKHLRASQGKTAPALSQIITRWQLDEHYKAVLAYIETMPLYIDLPDATIVHAFWEPGVPLAEQREHVLVGVKSGEEYLYDKYERPWYELYDGDKPLIVGHRDYTGVMKSMIYRDRVYGIDSRCVYGGALTGLLLPDFRLFSVPARKAHWFKIRDRYVKNGM